MRRLPSSVRAALQATQKDAPYAVLPTREVLLDAVRRAADHELTPAEADALVEQDRQARAWAARRDALRMAMLNHFGTADRMPVACHCASCRKWRAELERLTSGRS